MSLDRILKLPGALVFLALGTLFIIAACGGSPDGQSSNNDDQRSSQQEVDSSSGVPSIDEACEAFEGASGFGGLGGIPGGIGNVLSRVQGGPTTQAQYSKSPPSDEAEEIAKFFEDALNDAFDGGVSAECYWEISASRDGDSGRVLWVSLQLPSGPSSEIVQAIRDSLVEKGATVEGFFNTPGDDAAAMIMVGNLPLDLEGGSGGMLMITEDYAILMAGQGSESFGGQSSQPSAPAQASSSGNTSEPAPVQQVSADTQEITEWFTDRLEDSLDISLETEGTFEASFGGQNSLSVTFKIPEGSSLPPDVANRFENIVESANATVIATISAGGAAIVNFEGLEVGGITATGTMILDQDQGSIIATIQY